MFINNRLYNNNNIINNNNCYALIISMLSVQKYQRELIALLYVTLTILLYVKDKCQVSPLLCINKVFIFFACHDFIIDVTCIFITGRTGHIKYSLLL